MCRFICAQRQGFSHIAIRVIALAQNRMRPRCMGELPFGGGVLAQQVVCLTAFASRKVARALGLVSMTLTARALGTFSNRAGLCAVPGWCYA